MGENASLGKGCKYPTIYQKRKICVLMGRGVGKWGGVEPPMAYDYDMNANSMQYFQPF